jgi:hypothetical protein
VDSPTKSPASFSSSDSVRAGHFGDGVADDPLGDEGARLAVRFLEIQAGDPSLAVQPGDDVASFSRIKERLAVQPGDDVASYIERFNRTKQESVALAQEWGGRRNSWTRVHETFYGAHELPGTSYGSTSMKVSGEVRLSPRSPRLSPRSAAPPGTLRARADGGAQKANLRRMFADTRM